MNTYSLQKLLLLFVASHCFAQDTMFVKVDSFIRGVQLDSAQRLLETIVYDKKDTYYSGLHSYYQGVIFAKQDNHDKAFDILLMAKKQFGKIDSLREKANVNYQIFELLSHQKSLQVKKEPFLREFIAYAKSSENPLTLARSYSKIAGLEVQNNDFDRSIAYYKKALNELYKIHDTLRINLIEMNMGVAYSHVTSKSDSAFYYFYKTLPYFIDNNLDTYVSNNYNNQAVAYEAIGKYKKAIQLYEMANTYTLDQYDSKTRAIYYQSQLETYYKSGDFKSAFLTADKLLKLNDSLDNESQNNAIIEAENQYRASEKEKQNLILEIEIEKKERQQRNLWIGGGVLLFFGSLLTFLLYKNTRRKQLIAEQEREIEIRKAEKVMKDQELNTINAMIEGQEKERQVIASDLHDSVGATLSAARLQFEHLQKHSGSLENEKELFLKTGDLLNDAYQKVRSIAHVKNHGVIAKNGLLPAIRKLAKSASLADQLTVDVYDFGLTERIDNSLEINIFRIIQELVTNVIKHASATEANISITQLDKKINIIVEDNGKGFYARDMVLKDNGMGLSSIEKRVEHLEGSMDIDSTLGKGTNIIIDIPV